jgi:uncharacterized protein
MIHEFKVQNFLSIKEEQVLSFEATTDETLQDIYIVKKGKINLLKMGVIFGANASGKTNLIKSIEFLRDFVLSDKADKDRNTGHTSFAFDNNFREGNGHFDLSFFVDESRFRYTVELNNVFVVKEQLVYYPGSQPAMVFSRLHNETKDIAEVEFGSTMKLKTAEKSIIETNTLINMSVIAAFSKLNIDFPLLKAATSFFKNHLTPLIKPGTSLRKFTIDRLEKSAQTKQFLLDLLNNADISIDDMKVEKTPITMEAKEKLLRMLPLNEADAAKFLAEDKVLSKNLIFYHKLSEKGSIGLSIDVESMGTNRLFDLGGLLFEAISSKSVLLIDELENSLHPDLLIHFINTFLVNADEAQLIFTTHDINILSEQDNLRKDIIWFAQKSAEGATELYSMADFNHRKELSFLNAYKAGKFGAKPKLGSIYLKN